MEWPTKELGELADISRGSSPRPITDTRFFDGGTVPWIKIADATKSGKFLYKTKQHVNDFGASFSRRLPPGTILVAASGTLGYTQILGVEGCAHDGWLILQNLRGLDRDFAYYALKTLEQHFFNSGSGAAIQNINTDILRQAKIPYPPLPVQQRIASILSAYDELIENSQRRIKILEAMARGLYREWFVHFRFPGHENHPRVASALGEIPQGWEVKKLKDVCRLTMGQSPKSEFYNEVGDGVPFHQGVTDFGDRFPTDRLFCTAAGRIAEAGDILFSVRAPVGRMNIANKKIILGRGLSAIRYNEGSQAFLWEQLRNRFTKDDMMGNGAIFASVTKDDMQGIELVCPPPSVVEAATKHFEPLHSEIATLSQQIQNLRRTRDLLLPRLLSGQINVEAP